MTQDTAHYYLVSYTERAVPTEKKMIFRSFKEIETLLQRLHCCITVEQVDCADFNKPSRPFDEWKRKAVKEIDSEKHVGLSNKECFPEEHRQALTRKEMLQDVEVMEGKLNALEALKTSRDE